ncbi:carboxylate-amine ligase [Streptomyces sp. WMMB 714]|uniref:carboxylate-amine ligase n=1 Tax=Streptomyces sp. WMMB 714 TaxID=1286822 RepID=UPI00082379B4|nr:glutamate--cysteine ligase [Streptomyces sp. WMMB 714]SCK32133.1 carboxylate-amine ligase [Streptomyces sp. WMMB 714]
MADTAPVTAAVAGEDPRAAGAVPAAPGGGSLTVGVEEEFLILDEETGRPVPRAEEVLHAARPGPALPGDTQLKRELLACQVETASGVCTGLDALAQQLAAGRRRLADAARQTGLRTVASGTPVLAGPYGALSEGPRYEDISGIYAGAVADYEACGCHVHVGVPDRATAVEVVNHLRPWLPTLLALSANSPFDDGRDTGYASWRMVLQSRFPGSGVPPHLPSPAAYDAQLQRLVDCGTLADVRQSFWLARPSPCFPTVEFRAADTASTVDEAVLQAALSRALVGTALAAVGEGREAAPVDGQVAAAAVWSASRHGLRGPGVHPRLEREVPALTLVHELVAHVSPALEESGDLELVRGLLADVVELGTGAERQRAAAAAAPRPWPRAVVGHLVRETLRAPSSRRAAATAAPPASAPPASAPSASAPSGAAASRSGTARRAS